MFEKRFTVDGLSIQENSNKGTKYYLFQQEGVDSLCNRINQLFDEYKKVEEENKKLKEENESLNSQLIRLDKELFCQDCLTCRHSKSINIDVECAEGETEYTYDCDFYEISEEWVE